MLYWKQYIDIIAISLFLGKQNFTECVG